MVPRAGDGKVSATRHASLKTAAAWVGFALLAAWFAFFLQDHWTRFPRGLLTDDAYFYVKIAWNLGTNGISSFDGLHVTDGYHMLWAWILAGASAVAGIFSAAPAAHLGTMMWLYLMLCGMIAWQYGRSGSDTARNVFGFVVLVAMGLVFKVLMETTLLAWLILLLWEHDVLRPAGAPRRRGDAVRRAALLMLIPWVRIDAALIAGLLALMPLVPAGGAGTSWGARLRAAAGGVAWVVVGAASQLGVHRLIFGEWATVSMLIKGASDDVTWVQKLAQNFTGFYGANLLSVLIFVAFWALASLTALTASGRGRGERLRHLAALQAPALFVLFHLAANSTIAYWYFVPAVLPHAAYLLRWGLPGLAAAPSFGLKALRAASYATLVAVPLLFAAKWAGDTKLRDSQIRASRDFIAAVRELVPPGTPVYQIDASGWVGWFSQLPVVNGDGLVNDHDYVRRLRDDRLAGYLDEKDIRYIISNVHPENGLVLSQGGLVVPLEAVDILIAPPPDFPRLTAFGLYRLRATPGASATERAP